MPTTSHFVYMGWSCDQHKLVLDVLILTKDGLKLLDLLILMKVKINRKDVNFDRVKIDTEGLKFVTVKINTEC